MRIYDHTVNVLRPSQPLNLCLSIVLLPLLFIAACGLGMDNSARLARGQAAFESGEYRAAIIDARNILQQEPEHLEARLLLGRSALRVNDAATAEKELRRAMDLGVSPGSVAVDLGNALLSLRRFEQLLQEIRPELVSEAERLDILLLRGDAMMGLRRPESARALYLEVLAANSGDLPARIGVASSYIAEENFARARLTIDEALALDGEYALARLASGSLHLSMQDIEAAKAEFARALELATTASDADAQSSALIGLIDVHLARNDLPAAKVAAAQLRDLAPGSLAGSYVAARIAYLEEDFETAQAELQQVLLISPDYRPAQFLLAAVHLKRGNLGQAAMHLSPVISAAPNNADARKLMAEIHLQQDRADEALTILQPLLGSADSDADALNLAVRASLEAGKYDDAIGYLREELDKTPDNVDLQLDLAAAYLAAGKVDDAESLLSSSREGSQENAYRRDLLKVLSSLRREDPGTALRYAKEMAEHWPEDARVQNLIGGIALSTDALDLARESFMAARSLAPSDLSTYFNVARADVQQGDFDSARQQYLEALEQQPDAVEVMVALARLEARVENRAKAMEWLEKARSINPAAMMPRLLLARLYLNERSFESAAQVATEAVSIEDSSAEARNLLGLAQQGLNENAAALASFEQAVEFDPEESAYRTNRVRAQVALGNYALAERTLAEAGGIDLDNIQLSAMMAAVKARQGDADAAMNIARQLQSRHPDNGIPFALEAELLAAAGKFDQAAAVYDKALSLRPDDRQLALRAFQVRSSGGLSDPEAPLYAYMAARPLDNELRLVAAQSHQARGEGTRAIDGYEKVLTSAPDTYVALNNLAWEYFQSGDSRAEEFARRAHELAPQDGSVADTLGWILVNKGDLEGGIPLLRDAVRYSEGNPDVRYHLAAGLAAAGAKAEARGILEDMLGGEDFASRRDAEVLLASL